jgi:hypothetical protein
MPDPGDGIGKRHEKSEVRGILDGGRDLIFHIGTSRIVSPSRDLVLRFFVPSIGDAAE